MTSSQKVLPYHAVGFIVHHGKFRLPMSASLIGRLGSSTFRLSTTAVSMSLAGSCFSSESAPGPFHHGIRRRGGAVFRAALPSDERQVHAYMRTRLIPRLPRDIISPVVGSRFSFYWICSCPVCMMLARLVAESSGTRCRQPKCGASSQPTG